LAPRPIYIVALLGLVERDWQTTLLLVRPTSQSPQLKWNLGVWREIKPSQEDVGNALIELEARGIGIAINNQIAANQTQVN